MAGLLRFMAAFLFG